MTRILGEKTNGRKNKQKQHTFELYILFQLTRIPSAFPTIEFKGNISSIDDFTSDCIVLHGYKPQDTIKMDMAVWPYERLFIPRTFYLQHSFIFTYSNHSTFMYILIFLFALLTFILRFLVMT